MAIFFVTLFRNDEDKNETDNDDDDKEELHKWRKHQKVFELKNFNFKKRYRFIFNFKELSDGEKSSAVLLNHELANNQRQADEQKLVQIKRTKSKKLTKEIALNLIFLYVLFVACYSNRDENSFNYGHHLKSIFQGYDNVRFW